MGEIPGCPARDGRLNVCSDCGQIKPCNQMRTATKRLHQHDTLCKTCCNIRTRVYAESNEERLREYRSRKSKQRTESARRWREENPERNAETKRRWHARSKQQEREGHLRRTFGMTLDDYDALLAQQNGGCAICGGQCSTGPNLCIDHDRRCCPGIKSCGRCIRGLLCRKCNAAIGYMNDDPDQLIAAAEYVRRNLNQQDDAQAA